MAAARNNHPNTVRWLLNKEAMVNLENRSGMSALSRAVCSYVNFPADTDSTDTVRLLLESGADATALFKQRLIGNVLDTYWTQFAPIYQEFRDQTHNTITGVPNSCLPRDLLILLASFVCSRKDALEKDCECFRRDFDLLKYLKKIGGRNEL